MSIFWQFKTLAVSIFTVIVMAVVAFAQGADEAYVPFVVNVDATIRASQAGREDVVVTTKNKTASLTLPLGGVGTVWNTSGARLNAPAVTASRGNITLRLPAQSYQNAEIALYAVNGKRILRGKTAASEMTNAISRRNVVAGVYLLSVKGINGNAFTTRLTHNGGSVNINVAFGGGNISSNRRLAKSVAAGDWAITVSADGYFDYNETINPVKGLNDTVKVTLQQTATFVDGRDNKTYKKVTIGNQTWMAENLSYAAEGSVCYNNIPDSCEKYGRLYNWSTAMNGASSSSAVPSGVQGVCPVGWHIPSDAEWDTLMVAVGGVKDGDYRWQGAGTKLKSTSGWNYDGNGTDDFGFSALHGGYGNSDGGFDNAVYVGYWWSATEINADIAWFRSMYYSYEFVRREINYESYLHSVRCLQDGNGSVTTYTVTFGASGGRGTAPSAQTVNAGSSTTLPNGNNLSKNGYTFGGWNANSSGTGTNYSAGDSYTPTSNVTLYAKWVTPFVGTFTDGRENKTYKKVTIGNQAWMAENLSYATEGSKCHGEGGTVYEYNDNTGNYEERTLTDSEVQANCEKYGRLYNWSTAMNGASSSSTVPSGVQGVCPVGWHIPSDAEWDTLMVAVGGVKDGDNYWHGAGKKLRSITGWNYYSDATVGTDDFGFSAPPGGYGFGDGNFSDAGSKGHWWSAAEDGVNAWNRGMIYNYEDVYRSNAGKSHLFSVRCVAD